jgi:hypothetical protein
MNQKLKQRINDKIQQDNQKIMYQTDDQISELRKTYNLGMLTESELVGQTINLLSKTFRSLTDHVD